MVTLAAFLLICAGVALRADQHDDAQIAVLAALVCAVLSLRPPRRGWLSRLWHEEVDRQNNQIDLP